MIGGPGGIVVFKNAYMAGELVRFFGAQIGMGGVSDESPFLFLDEPHAGAVKNGRSGECRLWLCILGSCDVASSDKMLTSTPHQYRVDGHKVPTGNVCCCIPTELAAVLEFLPFESITRYDD